MLANLRAVTLRYANKTYLRPKPPDLDLGDNLPNVARLSRNVKSRTPPEQDLGVLDCMPLELLQNTLCLLDLSTLTDFRLVSRRATEVVNSIPQYNAIITYAPSIIQGISAIRMSQWITCHTLYETFCKAECEDCGEYGGYLYLLTCKRLCFLCVTQNKRYLPLNYRWAFWLYGHTHETLRALPQARTIPGFYSVRAEPSLRSDIIFDRESTHLAGVEMHGSEEAIRKYKSKRERAKPRKDDPPPLLRFPKGRTCVMGPIICTEDDTHDWKALRFMAVISVPYFDSASQKLRPGFYCIGCKDEPRSPQMHSRRLFTDASFETHLREFGKVLDGKHVPA